MSRSGETYGKVIEAGREFKLLQEVFQNFGTLVRQQLEDSTWKTAGVTCDDSTEDGVIRMTFVGKSIQLVFNVIGGDDGKLQGRVTGFLASKYPEPKNMQLDLFTFDRRGRSSIKDEDGDDIFIDHDNGAFLVALQFLEKSLPY